MLNFTYDLMKLENRDSNEIGEGTSQTVEWYPRQKLDIARRKLELENPACILIYLNCDFFYLSLLHNILNVFDSLQILFVTNWKLDIQINYGLIQLLKLQKVIQIII